MATMNKLRNELHNGFTIMPNEIVRDPALSWKAKGILLYLASKPNGWDFYVDEIKKHATDGKTALKSGLKELTDAGYLKRSNLRGDDGKISGREWVLLVPKSAFQGNQSTSRKPSRREHEPPGTSAAGDPTTSNTDNNKTDNTNTEPYSGRASENGQVSLLPPDDTGAETEYYIPDVSDVTSYFEQRGDMIPKDIPGEAEKFMNHYAEREWKNTSKRRIKFWRRQAANWCNRYKQFQENRIKKYHDEKDSEKNTIGHAERLSKKFDNAWED